ncbi:hypothetical protein Hanom_Chr15g01364901 [Helianthus anomalus]
MIKIYQIMDSLSYHFLNTILHSDQHSKSQNQSALNSPTLYTNSIFLRRCSGRCPIAVSCTIYP